MLSKQWGPSPKKPHLVSPPPTIAGRRCHGRTRGAWSSKYCVGCGGQQGPLRGRTDVRHNLNAKVLREAQQRRRLVSPASSRHAIHLQPGMVTMKSGQLLFSRVDEGVRDLNYFGRRRYMRFVSKRGLSMQWRRRLANPCIV
jgi:hypothetical protein